MMIVGLPSFFFDPFFLIVSLFIIAFTCLVLTTRHQKEERRRKPEPNQGVKPLSRPAGLSVQSAQRSKRIAGVPAVNFSGCKWLEFTRLVAQLCPLAPDEGTLRELVGLCRVASSKLFNSEEATWPLNWMEPIDDLFWTKFLMASQFNVDKAVEVADAYITSPWRESSLRTDCLRYFDGRFFAPCTTRNGLVVGVLRLKYHKQESSGDVERWFSVIMDAVIAWNMMQRQKGMTAPRNKLERYVFIVDLAGVGRENIDLKGAKALASLAQSRYPDFMQTAYIINASRAVTACWSAVKCLANERLQSKYVILGRGDTAPLANLIEEKDLPMSLGGSGPEWLPPAEMSQSERLGVFAPLFASDASEGKQTESPSAVKRSSDGTKNDANFASSMQPQLHTGRSHRSERSCCW